MIRAVRKPVEPAACYEDLGSDAARAGQARARAEGNEYDEIAYTFAENAGGRVTGKHFKIDHISVDGLVEGPNGNRFWLLAHGTVDTDGRQAGFRRTDTIRKAGSAASQLRQRFGGFPVLVLTSNLPTSPAARGWLRGHRNDFFDVIATTGDLVGFHRLHRYLTTAPPPMVRERADWCDPTGQLSLDSILTTDVERLY